jgi:CubicO group peptidase (beta-lactamase class C family)
MTGFSILMNLMQLAWRQLPVLSCFLLMSGCATYHPVNVDQSRLLPERQQQVVDQVKAAMKKGDITGLSLAVVDKGGLLWSGNFGFADKAKQQTPNANTLYRIGSITKLFTATAIAQLHERGLLDLHDPVSKHLPELKVADCFGGPDITIAQLLTHQSGLPHSYEPNFWSGDDWRGVTANLSCDMVPYRPGLIVSYSNIAYTLLGNIIEKVSGEPYERYVLTQILGALHIEAEDALFESQGKLSDPRFAEGIAHAYDMSGKQVAEPSLRDLPAGGIYATSAAVGKFLTYSLRGDTTQGKALFLNQNSAWDMLRPHDLENPLSMDLKVGWGWFLRHSHDGGFDDIALHGGSTKFHQGQVLLSPQRGVGIVLLANSGSRDELQELSKRLLTLIAPPDESSAKRTVVKTNSQSVNFCANEKIPGYYSSEGGVVKVAADGRDLTAAVGDLRLQLKATESNYFDPSIRLFGFLPLGKSVFKDLQISLRCTDDLSFAAVKEKSDEFSVAYRIRANKQSQLDNKWLGRYKLLGVSSENDASLRLWREGGELFMETEHLPVSVDKKSFLLSAMGARQARALYLSDQWGPLLSFSDSSQGMLAKYQGFTLIKVAP